jgi:hypothetical protein
MKNIKNLLLAFVIAAIAQQATARVDLVTLPTRDAVQLTIYNSADLTLVRDSRKLTLAEGDNTLQFSWANTLIDPTSLDLVPLRDADKIDILELIYPPRVKDSGIWNIKSSVSGKVPMKINYFTSGLSWRAFYMGTLADDEKNMRLQGYVIVNNNSGEDYENAQTRLIVGKVQLLDEIAALARRPYPYGSPVQDIGGAAEYAASPMILKSKRQRNAPMAMAMDSIAFEMEAPKEIVKEGLSEYFLYTIEGTETIPNGWSKRLPSFDTADIPVKNLYKYDESRFGTRPMRFLSFKNDEEHQLGDTPIPGGSITVYRQLQQEKLSYEGQSSFKYIPVGEDIELQLGPTQKILVEAKLMDTSTYDFLYDNNLNINGWKQDQLYTIEVSNTRPIPIRIEIKRHFNTTAWDIKNTGDCGDYEKVDARSVKYTLELPPRSKQTFNYLLTTRYGRQIDR